MIAIKYITLVCISVYIQSLSAFYIPGVAPLDFTKGEYVEVKVMAVLFFLFKLRIIISLQAVKMTSTKTQLPYDYYDVAVHCKPKNGTKYKSENLGK